MTEHERIYELMSAHLDGELDDAGRRELAKHLASCPDCRELMAVMRGARGALSEEAEPPEELLSAVMSGVRRAKTGRRAARRRYVGAAAGLAAAAVLAVTFMPGMFAAKSSDPGAENELAAYSLEPRAQEPVAGNFDDAQTPAVCMEPVDGQTPAYTPGAEDPASGEPEDQSENTKPFGEVSTGTTVPVDLPDTNPTEPVDVPPLDPAEPEDGDLVTVTDYIPDIYVDLKYATEDNFTGQVIYDFSEATLRYGTVKKLAAVQEELAARGLSLKIWDAYRPVSAQFDLWEVCPDSRYVADPTKGYSGHSRGNTVDVTLVNSDGTQVEMPTGFDDFTARADRDYSDVSTAAAENAKLLEDLMTAAGFKPYSAEWWHFTDTVGYPVVE